MGCTASQDNSQYLLQIEQLRQQMEQDKLKAHEQQNLLRFKVEVLVNMLAVEEKRNEEHAQRIDTMQWLLSKQGINEEYMSQLLLKLDSSTRDKFHSSIAEAKFGDKMMLPDVGTVVDKMRDEFNNNRDDILHAFCRSDGKILSIVPADKFTKHICEVTETLTPLDAKVLAVRFDDGTGGYVSITEFIDFFVTPPSVRTARVAAAAVRMSLDLFALNVELLDNINEDDPDFLLTEKELECLPPEMRKTHFTDILDRGAKRLLVMWPVVRDELEKQFSIYAKKNEVEQVIEIEIFDNTLDLVCGPFSELLETLCKEGKISMKTAPKPIGFVDDHKLGKVSVVAESKGSTKIGKKLDKDSLDDKNKENKDMNSTPVPPPKLTSSKESADSKPPKTPINFAKDESLDNTLHVTEKTTLLVETLDKEDIAFLAERFELAGAIHYGYFLEFFDSTFKRFIKYKRKFKIVPDEASGISPFVYSSEWNALKASSILRKSKDHIRMSRSIDKKPIDTPIPKVFTAPKQLPPPKTEEKPKEVIVVESPPEKPVESIIESPPLKPEPPKAEEKTEEKDKSEETKPEKKEESKVEESKEVPPSTPGPEPIKTAPVVTQSGCFCCSLGKPEPKKQDVPPIAESKAGVTPPAKPLRETPLHKQVTIDVDTPPEKESKDIADSKEDLPPIKRSESPRPFRVPKGFDSDSTSSDDGGMLPNREGLGHGRNDDTPIIQPKPKGSRFRRREEQDFAREKRIEEDPEEMEEDQRYTSAGKK